jgi:hypothetical protein
MARELRFFEIKALPEEGDVITRQYFEDTLEIRANMTGFVGTGTLLAKFEGYVDTEPTSYVMTEMDTLVEMFCSIGGKADKDSEEECVSGIQEVKDAVQAFGTVQDKWLERGAGDTEPDGEFQVVMVKAAEGERAIPETPRDWQLYSYNTEEWEKSLPAAEELKKAAEVVADTIIRHMDSVEVQKYIEDFCWRV